jgi:hypothetical protein
MNDDLQGPSERMDLRSSDLLREEVPMYYSVLTFGPDGGAGQKAYRSLRAARRAARRATRASSVRIGRHTTAAAARAADISTTVPVEVVR